MRTKELHPTTELDSRKKMKEGNVKTNTTSHGRTFTQQSEEDSWETWKEAAAEQASTLEEFRRRRTQTVD